MTSEQTDQHTMANSNPSYEGVATSSVDFTPMPSPNDDTIRNRHQTHRSDPGSSHPILQRLPSRNKGNSLPNSKSTTLSRRKSKKKAAYELCRLGPKTERQHVLRDLMTDEDFIDGTEEQQNDDLRNMTIPLTDKKYLRSSLDTHRTNKRKDRGISWWTRKKYSIAVEWRHFLYGLREITVYLEPWQSHIKVIEGRFGTGVTSYFLFLKWLFYMNLPPCLLQVFLIVTPQALYRWHQQEPPGYNSNISYSAAEIITGSGWMSNTEMYYGFYYPGVIQLSAAAASYNMQYAYICTTAVYYMMLLFIVSYSLMRSYKKNYIETSGAVSFYYINKVLSGWDHNVTSQHGANRKHDSIYQELVEYCSTFRSHRVILSCGQWFIRAVLRMCAHFLVIGMLAGSGYLVWHLSINQSLKSDVAFLNEMALPLSISAINYLFPFAFSLISVLENYQNPRVTLYLTMVRSIVLNSVSLGVLIFYWYSEVDCSSSQQSWQDENRECKSCWENFMGEQLYRLVIVDFIFIVLLTLISEFGMKVLSKFVTAINTPQFNIGRNTLYLIYSQALIWLASFYSPLVTSIMVLKLFIIFYIKRYSVTFNCRPSVKPWRGGRTHTVIMGLLFITFLACFVSTAYGIVFIHPSVVCGPYQGYNSSYHVITNLFDQWESQYLWLKEIIEFVTSAGFLYAVLIGFCVIVHYARMVSAGWTTTINQLRHQIMLEGKDKQFLLSLLQDVVRKKAPKRSNRLTQHDPDTGSLPYPTIIDNNDNPGKSPDHVTPGHSGISRTRPSTIPAPPISNHPGAQMTSRDSVNPTYRDRTPGDVLDDTLDSLELQSNPSYMDSSPNEQQSYLTTQT